MSAAVDDMERRLRRHLAQVEADLVEAYDQRDWEPMGYPSWDAYLTGEFGEGASFAASLVARWRP